MVFLPRSRPCKVGCATPERKVQAVQSLHAVAEALARLGLPRGLLGEACKRPLQKRHLAERREHRHTTLRTSRAISALFLPARPPFNMINLYSILLTCTGNSHAAVSLMLEILSTCDDGGLDTGMLSSTVEPAPWSPRSARTTNCFKDASMP